MPTNDFVEVATEGAGPRIKNVAVQAFVDHGDGAGPQLVTVFMQVTAIWPVDANGNAIEQDEFLIGADWKKQLLDELRAVRLGMEMLTQNTKYMPDEEASLIEKSQCYAEEEDRLNVGREATENRNTSPMGG